MKTKYIAIAGIVLAAVACNKENVPQIDENYNGRVTVTFNANPCTKIAYTEDAAKEYYNINWSEENEAVGLFAVDATGEQANISDLFKFTREHDNVFKGEVDPWEGDRTIAAFWPYNPDRVITHMPENQYVDANVPVFEMDMHFNRATVPAGDDEYSHTMLRAFGKNRTYNNIGNLEFKQLFSIVKMNITGVPSEAKVESIEVHSSGDVHNGKTVSVIGYFSLLDEEKDLVRTFQTLVLNVSGTENGQDCMLNLPILTNMGLKIQGYSEDGDIYTFVVNLSDGSKVEKTLANRVLFEKGHVYKLDMPLN